MSNSFYTHGSFPSTGSAATSATMRNELDLITAGFDKLPTLASGSANQVVVLSATGLAMTTTSSLNGISIGGTTAAAGAFTTLSASSTVSGAGFTNYLASPPAIGGTAAAAITGTTITANTGFAGALNGTVGGTTPAAGAFTSLSASSTVSGTGFSTYLASPPAIGGTAAAAGSFTTLSASSTVSGTGFSTYLASPPAIGGTAAAAITGTTITANTSFAGALNGTVGATTPAAGAFTTLSASSTVSGTGFSTYLASPPAIGGTAAAAITGTTITANTSFAGALNGTVGATTPAAGAFTTLSASSTVSGIGFSDYLASPPAIGGTTAAAGTFTALTYSTTLTGGTGIVNLGSGQFYKDASGNVGIGTTSPTALLQLSSTGNPGLVFDGTNQSANLKRIRLVTQIAAAGDFAIQSMNDAGTVKSTNFYIDPEGDVGIGTTTPTSGLQTAGSSSKSAFKTPNIAEVDTISATAATGTINFDITTQSVLYYTSNASGNWTLNFRGSSGTTLNTVMSTGESLSATFLVTNGATAYYNSAVTIDGTSVTPKWQGGSAPTSGNASSTDAYTYVIQKTGSATYVVLASQTKFA